MKPSEREESLFADVIARPVTERAAFLAQVCGDDVAMLARIESLVSAHETEASLLDNFVPVPTGPLFEECPGDTVGRYRLVQIIGEGKTGVVWLAEEADSRRRVALKVITQARDVKAVLARYSALRPALETLNHPNIARVFEAGTTEMGRPCFAMEFVRGPTITKHCDRYQLTLGQRLELFLVVCDAVAHAHAQGVAHAGLRPAKIVVMQREGQVAAKVIGFGVATSLLGLAHDRSAGGRTDGSARSSLPRTDAKPAPDLKSIKQADIHALGRVLYELLTGQAPAIVAEPNAKSGRDPASPGREARIPTPVNCLHSFDETEQVVVARLRSTVPQQLARWLRGDLEWIVMHCLEKDPARRYDRADALAGDLRRFLRNERVAGLLWGTDLLDSILRRPILRSANAATFLVSCVRTLASKLPRAGRAKQGRQPPAP